MGKRYEIRSINGRKHRVCRGPLHEGQWLPVVMFRYRSDRTTTGERRLRSWCSACENLLRNGAGPLDNAGFVPLAQISRFVTELENRLGRIEAARRVGVGKTTWYHWVNQDRRYVQRQKVAMLMSVLQDVREEDEVRHRRSIKRGAAARGEQELQPTRRKHLYRPHGDHDAEVKRKFVQEAVTRQREREEQLERLAGY